MQASLSMLPWQQCGRGWYGNVLLWNILKCYFAVKTQKLFYVLNRPRGEKNGAVAMVSNLHGSCHVTPKRLSLIRTTHCTASYLMKTATYVCQRWGQLPVMLPWQLPNSCVDAKCFFFRYKSQLSGGKWTMAPVCGCFTAKRNISALMVCITDQETGACHTSA